MNPFETLLNVLQSDRIARHRRPEAETLLFTFYNMLRGNVTSSTFHTSHHTNWEIISIYGEHEENWFQNTQLNSKSLYYISWIRFVAVSTKFEMLIIWNRFSIFVCIRMHILSNQSVCCCFFFRWFDPNACSSNAFCHIEWMTKRRRFTFSSHIFNILNDRSIMTCQ